MFLLNPAHAHRTLFNRIGSFIDISYAMPPALKSTKKNQSVAQIKYTFVDLEDSKEEPKKESFTNEVEANAIADLLAAFDLDLATCAVMTPYRTQSLAIKNCIQEQRDDLPKKVKQFSTIGSFEEFISQRFNTLIISHCKTENIEKGGPLFSLPMIEFLLSRLNQQQSGT